MTKTGMQPCCRCKKREAPPWHRIGREEDAPAKSRPLRRHGTKDEQRSVMQKKKKAPKGLLNTVSAMNFWRREPESNWSNRICNPGHNRFAIAPRSLSNMQHCCSF